MKSGWGTLGVLIVAVIGVVPSTGCTPLACPAIGYVSSITVNIEGNAAAVDRVSVCGKTGCSQPEPTAAPAPSKTVVTEFAPAPQPTVSLAPFYSHREDKDTWVFTLNSGTPPEVTVKAIAADGTVIAEKDQGLVWTRVGGTEQCGGPITTPPIQFAVP
ncbi:hypothetical protein F8G81_06230 [Arthrobacter sp. CDRTa11]|uniref:hypothetical protein n=1 Tax=Arthrobacter sp. CDRTa11 TaxID=2651199 RepID=UPI002265DA79|nr:hypothetical protein [Arthrobacter sp. CDRTa11]UZX02259.1 hypothetical protein F8G81_06230 [Arthrobacter sp. CDRTa11]